MLFGILICVSLFAFAQPGSEIMDWHKVTYSDEDVGIAQDLSALSGLPESVVLGLYDARGDWATITENIFLYKALYAYRRNWSFPDSWFLERAKQYEPGALLAAFEYAEGVGMQKADVSTLLSLAKDNETLTDLVAANAFLDAKSYKNYQPATEEQIRAFFDSGYTVEEILQADEAARQLDCTITDILEGKVAPPKNMVTKEIVGGNLPSFISVIQADGKKIMYQGDSWQSVADSLEQIYSSGNRTAEETFTTHDLQNAEKLSDETGMPEEDILALRESGMEWSNILTTCREGGEVR